MDWNLRSNFREGEGCMPVDVYAEECADVRDTVKQGEQQQVICIQKTDLTCKPR